MRVEGRSRACPQIARHLPDTIGLHRGLDYVLRWKAAMLSVRVLDLHLTVALTSKFRSGGTSMRDVRISHIVGLACGVLFLAMPVASQADDRRDCFALGMESAIEACTKAIASGGAKGDDLAALYNARGAEYDTLADFLQDTENNLARAIADYDEAIRLNPNYSTAYYNRGTWYLAKDDFDRAIADLNEAIRIGPQGSVRGTDFGSRQGDEQKADYFHARGQAHFAKQDTDRAIVDYDEAIRFNPDLTRAFINRGLAYRAKGDSDRANEDFDQAIKLDPEIKRP